MRGLAIKELGEEWYEKGLMNIPSFYDKTALMLFKFKATKFELSDRFKFGCLYQGTVVSPIRPCVEEVPRV